MRFLLIMMALFLVACNEEGQAGTDEGLYDPVAPKGSAFVRFVNIDDASHEIKANGKSYGSLDQNSASSYFVVKKGNAKFSIGSNAHSEEINEGQFYTVALGDDIKIIEDKSNDNETKSTLALYNLNGANPIQLKAKEGTVTVVDNVTKGAMNTRDINPVEIDLSVTGEGIEAIMLKSLIMERGNHYSIIYNGKSAFIVQAKTDTTK